MIVKISFLNRLMTALMMVACLGIFNLGHAQGRVIINEFSTGLSVKNSQDFIELKNVGISSVNISNYSLNVNNELISFPKNTILAEGNYFVVYTSKMISKDKSNISIVLNDSTSTMVDAVSGKSSDLNNSKIESLLDAKGIGSVFARKTDGDCAWMIDSLQTMGASNQLNGASSSIQISKLVAMNTNCSSGKVNFTIENANPEKYFSVSYVLGFDANNDGKFTANDRFEKGKDSSAPVVEINNLYSTGTYKIMLEPINGCNQQVFDFKIDPCITMAVRLKKFTGNNNGKVNNFNIEIETDADLKELRLEASINGSQFDKIANVPFENRAGLQNIQFNSNPTQQSYFRIAMTDVNNKTTYSPIVHLNQTAQPLNKMTASPNPFTDMLNLNVQSDKNEKAVVNFYATNGAMVYSQTVDLTTGNNNIRLQTNQLQKGLYIVAVRNFSNQQPQIARLMKG